MRSDNMALAHDFAQCLLISLPVTGEDGIEVSGQDEEGRFDLFVLENLQKPGSIFTKWLTI